MSLPNPESRDRIAKLLNSSLYGEMKKEPKAKKTFYTINVISEIYDENDEFVKVLDVDDADDDLFSEGEIENMVKSIKKTLDECNKPDAEFQSYNQLDREAYDYDPEMINYPEWTYIDSHVYVEYRSFNTAIIYAQIKCKPNVE